MITTRLVTATQELEQALSALDTTIQDTTRRMQAKAENGNDQQSDSPTDEMPISKICEELSEVRAMVNRATELIARARGTNASQESDRPEKES